jgi:hypothetical protein
MSQFAGVLVHFSKPEPKSGAIGSVPGKLANVPENWFIFQKLNQLSKALAHLLQNSFIFLNLNPFPRTLAHSGENESISQIFG